MPEISTNYHDQNFKSLMSEPHFFNGFLQTYLPEKIQQDLDLNSVEISKKDGKHLEQKTHKVFEADLVYLLKAQKKIKYQNTIFLLHIEHQSSPDPLISLRISNYQSAELLAYAMENPKRKSEPKIMSLIYYQGRKPWKYKFEQVFTGQIIFIDLQAFSDQELMRHQTIGPIEVLLKNIRHKDYKNKIKFLLPPLQKYNDRIREILLKYLFSVTTFSESEFLDLVETCLPTDGEKAMTLAERLIKKGKLEGKLEAMTLTEQLIKKGKLEGVKEVAKRLLLLEQSPTLIHEVTGLSLKEIAKIRQDITH